MPIIVIREHENDVNNGDFLPFFVFLVTGFHAL